ncbi:MAG: S-methyl-5'-thioadenosine phosphorylase [Myxococcota bacterium]|jgi:5'-methylthioadenosine phosphorylase|nr:S-methyl-5'-thioadenosine phosphorylase [Myxococcota bacterium]
MPDLHPAPLLAIIGGSGVYDLEDLKNPKWRHLESPWGEPSDDVLFGELAGVRVALLPRHGRRHQLNPSKVNYRANIDVLKRAGATDILSLSSVGSFREELHPGTYVIVDQFIDRTFARAKTFFDASIVAHVSMAHPVNPRLGDWCEDACRAQGIAYRRGGTYLAMEGPQFSTLAESELYRQWGCDVIGMTNMPEAKLAREAEIPYCSVAMVTDYDCWHPDHENVDVEAILSVMRQNVASAKGLVRALAPRMAERPAQCPSGDDTALEGTIITHGELDPENAKALDAVAGRVLKQR